MVYYTSVIGDKDYRISNLEAEVARLNAEVDTLNAKVRELNSEIARKNNLLAQKNDEIFSLNNQIASLGSQIADLSSQIDELTNQIASKPKLVVDGLTVEDDRSSIPYNLHVYGRVNNTGGGTAYNAFLYIMAFSAEGVAIDTYYYFGGMHAKKSVGLDFRLNYTGSPIESWVITPLYSDEFASFGGTFPP